jgi:hypothetical protein
MSDMIMQNLIIEDNEIKRGGRIIHNKKLILTMNELYDYDGT